MEALRILHLSDIHFGIRDKHQQQKRIANDIISCVQSEIEQNQCSIDLCIISGDITQSGDEAQYKAATTWVKKLFKVVKCPLFIVPGNHEVQRPSNNEESLIFTGLRRSASVDPDLYEEHRMCVKEDQDHAFCNFYKWLDTLKEAKVHVISDWDPEKFNINTRYKYLHLVGLNSAVLSCNNSDDGNLAIDLPSLNQILDELETTKECVIFVAHHPVVDENGRQVLVEWNAKEYTKIIESKKGPHLLLHGHTHKSLGSSLVEHTGQSVAVLGAGAGYIPPKKYPMSFAIYDIIPDQQTIGVSTFSFNPEETHNGWVKDATKSSSIRAVLPRSVIDQESNYIKTAKHNSKALQRFKKATEKRSSGNLCFDKIHHKYEVDDKDVCTVTESVLFNVANQSRIWFGDIFVEPHVPPHHWSDLDCVVRVMNMSDKKEIETSTLHILTTDELDTGEQEFQFVTCYHEDLVPGKEYRVETSYKVRNLLSNMPAKKVDFEMEYLNADKRHTTDLSIEILVPLSYGDFTAKVSGRHKSGTSHEAPEVKKFDSSTRRIFFNTKNALFENGNSYTLTSRPKNL